LHLKALVTGSGGLIGSACVKMLAERGWEVAGIDNNMRREFFGERGSTEFVVRELCASFPRYHHHSFDIRDRQRLRDLTKAFRPEFIIHTAGQPSHDLAASIPYDDFDINAVGTLNLLVAARDCCADSPFCFTSTNKVYGDTPNHIPMVELETRYDFSDGRIGIDETMSIDHSLHSLFGVSKLAADMLCQEFGRYFNMPVGIFRCGCLTGPQHAAVELHGFLSYIAHAALTGAEYTIFGYKGKQVRDQIHCMDVASLFLEFYANPRCGEVYNLGGGRENSWSILETIEALRSMGLDLRYRIEDVNRIGDHICYISDLTKVRAHYLNWRIKFDIMSSLVDVVSGTRLSNRIAGSSNGSLRL